MRQRAGSARDVLRRHPWAISLIESRATPGPATLRDHDAVIGCLRHAGFSMELVGHAFAAIDSYFHGVAMQEANVPFTTPEDTAAMAVTFLEQFPSAQYPHLAQLTTDLVMKPCYDFATSSNSGST